MAALYLAVLLLAVVLLVAHPLVAVLFLVLNITETVSIYVNSGHASSLSTHVLFRVVAVLALVVLYQGL